MVRIRLFVVDEGVLDRDSIHSIARGLPDVEVVGLVPTGRMGIERCAQLSPDLVLVSVGLADVSAIQVTAELLEKNPQLAIIVSCTRAPAQADRVVEALEVGAVDFVLKPERTEADFDSILARRLVPKLRTVSAALYSRLARSLSTANAPPPPRPPIVRRRSFDVVVVGVSTGGPEALSRPLPALSGALPVPVVVVVHMPRLFTGRLAASLDDKAALRVEEATDGAVLSAGGVYLAPGGVHVALARRADRLVGLRMDDGPAQNGCKPSVDVLFRSAAEVVGGEVLALIMTGMGIDGTAGLEAIRAVGGYVVAQDEQSSVVWGMPGSAVRRGVVHEVLPLAALAGRIEQLVKQ